MRLKQVERGHRLPQKVMLGMIWVMTGRRAPDILRTLLYQPELFGTPFAACLQAVMRRPSGWTSASGSFSPLVSRKNQCPF